MARRPKPWYRKDRGTFCVVIDRKRYNLGPDKQRAYAKFYKLINQPRRQVQVVEDAVASVFEAYLDYVQETRSPGTFEWCRGRLKRFHESHPDMLVADLKPHHVERWAIKPGQKVNTRRNNMRAVKQAFKWAVEQDILERNPLATLKIPAGTERVVVVSQEEIDRLLEYVTDPSFLDMLVFVMQTGCRPQEAWKLEARHIDPVARRAVLSAAEAKGAKRPRAVYLPDRAYEIIEPLVQTFPSGSLFRNSRGRAWNKDSVGCMFDRINIRMGKQEMRRRGEEISAKQIADFTKELAKTKNCQGKLVNKTAAELRCEAKRKLSERRARQLSSRYSLYAFRHTWATKAYINEVDSVVIGELMGHKDPSMVAKVYQHVALNPKFMSEQAEKAAGY